MMADHVSSSGGIGGSRGEGLGRHILLIGDVDVSLRLLNRLDQDGANFEIDSTTRIGRARAILRSSSVDCAIVVETPLQDGTWSDCLVELRDVNPTVPVVVLTTSPSIRLDATALDREVAASLPLGESVRPRRLIEVLDRVFEERRWRRIRRRRASLATAMSDIARGFLGDGSMDGLLRSICERLVATDLYRHVWVGGFEDGMDTLSVLALAGMRPVGGGVGIRWRLLEAINWASFTGDVTISRTGPVTDDIVVPITEPIELASGHRLEDAVLVLGVDRTAPIDEVEQDLLDWVAEGISTHAMRRRGQEAARRERRAIGAGAWASSAIPAALVLFDGSARIIAANAAAISLLDRTPEGISGTYLWDVSELCTPVTFGKLWRGLEEGSARDAGMDRLDHPVQVRPTTVIEDDGRRAPAMAMLSRRPARSLEWWTGEGRWSVEPELAGGATSIGVCLLLEGGVGIGDDGDVSTLVAYELAEWIDQARSAVDRARRRGERYHFKMADRALTRMEDVVTAGRIDPSAILQVAAYEPTDVHTVARVAWQHVYGGRGNLYVLDAGQLMADYQPLLRFFEHAFRDVLERNEGTFTVKLERMDDGFAICDDGRPPESGWLDVDTWGFDRDRTDRDLRRIIIRRIAEAHGWTLHGSRSDDGNTRLEIRGVEWCD